MNEANNLSAFEVVAPPMKVVAHDLIGTHLLSSSDALALSAESIESEDSSCTLDYMTDDRSSDSSEDLKMQGEGPKSIEDLVSDGNNSTIPGPNNEECKTSEPDMEDDQDSGNETNADPGSNTDSPFSKKRKKKFATSKKFKFKFKKSIDDDPNDPKKSCDICFRRFAYRGAVKRHKREVHCIVRKHICPTCNKPFARNGTLRIHLLTHTGEKPHVCKVCGKSYRQSSQLTEHSVVHTGDKRFICSVCGDCFPTRSKLNRHKIIHSDERPFVCDICQRGFRTMMNMLDHRPVHSDYKPFICCMCGKSFHTFKNLQSHERGHQIKHMCSSCNKGFSRPSALAEHMLTHLKIKPFPCKLCDKNFSRQKSLQEHMALHTGDKPYACDICDKKFCRMKALKRHSMVHQKN